jgi:hypothetical protein
MPLTRTAVSLVVRFGTATCVALHLSACSSGAFEEQGSKPQQAEFGSSQYSPSEYVAEFARQSIATYRVGHELGLDFVQPWLLGERIDLEELDKRVASANLHGAESSEYLRNLIPPSQACQDFRDLYLQGVDYLGFIDTVLNAMHENNPASEDLIQNLTKELQASGIGGEVEESESSLDELAKECGADWHALRRQFWEE